MKSIANEMQRRVPQSPPGAAGEFDGGEAAQRHFPVRSRSAAISTRAGHRVAQSLSGRGMDGHWMALDYGGSNHQRI